MKKAVLGFTLIELLVVIAIIGILAAVVLTSLNDARGSAINSSVAQTVTNMRPQAEIFYTAADNDYTGMCNVGTDIDRLADGVIAANNAITAKDRTLGNLQDSTTFMCHIAIDGSAYAVSAPLVDVGNGQEYFCADSTGFAGVISSALPANKIMCQ